MFRPLHWLFLELLALGDRSYDKGAPSITSVFEGKNALEMDHAIAARDMGMAGPERLL